MRIAGRRVQIAGSADPKADVSLLTYAHSLVEELVGRLVKKEALLLVNAGKEPLREDGRGPSIVFDWTVLATAAAGLEAGVVASQQGRRRLITVVATEKTESQIPAERRQAWQIIRKREAVQLEYVDPGWSSGAIRRVRQASMGDVLVAISGGEGVEHLVQVYARAGKPVIVLDLDIGSSSADGSGGAAQLAKRARAHPERFIRLSEPAAAGALLADISCVAGTRPTSEVADGVMRLLDAAAAPTAFYVRLQDRGAAEFSRVEEFFRSTVDPSILELGYERVEVGVDGTQHAWMNQAIFDSLHHARLAVVDLTGERQNCYMELGYALGRGLTTVITAQCGTRVHFDATMLETHFWDPSKPLEERIRRFREHFDRASDRPPIVVLRDLL